MLKKAALGLTMFLTVTTAVACAPGADGGDQGAIDDRNMRGAGQFQERAGHDNRTIGAYDVRNGLGTRNQMFGRGTGIQNENRGFFGQNQGLFGQNRGLFGQDRGPIQQGRGGFLNGGTAPRMHGGATAPDQMAPGGNLADQYDTTQSRALKQRVLSIPGVRDANVIIQGDDVICSVETDGRRGDVMERVRQVCQEEVQGARVHVTDDEMIFRRVGDMDGRLQQGNMRDAGMEFQNLLRDLGRNITGNQR
jgi:hypothetical protein